MPARPDSGRLDRAPLSTCKRCGYLVSRKDAWQWQVTPMPGIVHVTCTREPREPLRR